MAEVVFLALIRHSAIQCLRGGLSKQRATSEDNAAEARDRTYKQLYRVWIFFYTRRVQLVLVSSRTHMLCKRGFDKREPKTDHPWGIYLCHTVLYRTVPLP